MKRLFCFLFVSALGLAVSCESDSTETLGAPTALQAVGVTYDSATLEWQHPTADKHEVVVGGGAARIVTAPTLSLDDLTPETKYTWKVRSGKGDVWSEWVDGKEFTTKKLTIPDEPTGLDVRGVTISSAILTWNSGEEKYEVAFGDDEPILVTELTNGLWMCQVTDLTPGTAYTSWKVRAGNSGGGWSEWVDGPEFSTPAMEVLIDPDDFVFVEGGTFTMGSDAEYATSDESPAHQVTVGDFYISKYEVTQLQWSALMTFNTSFSFGDQRPVQGMFFEEAEIFIELLNAATGEKYALPTEAQWEYAARGGNQSQGYKYAGSDEIDDVAWYFDNSAYDETKPVGTKSPNELGLYDMTGNVWEWCTDWFGEYPSSPQTDPVGPSSGAGHVVRGSGWSTDLEYCHLTYRMPMNPVMRGGATGLRLVRLP